MRSRVFVFVIAFACFFTMALIANYYIGKHFSNQLYLSEQPGDVVSELNHLSKLKKINVIFIGDSRTRYQIDSHVINRYLHKTVFNAGIDGYFYPYWMQLFKAAVSLKPDFVVLSLNPYDIYSSYDFKKNKSNTESYVSFSDIPDLIHAPTSLKNIAQFTTSAVNHMIDFYFSAFAKAFVVIDMHKHVGCYEDSSTSKEDVYYCPNNAGYLISKKVMPVESMTTPNYRTSTISPLFLSYLQNMKHLAKINHVQLVIILVPHLFQHPYLNRDKLQAALNLKIIDLSNFMVKTMYRSYWADPMHLNENGRKLYSIAVASALSSVVKGVK